MWKPSIFAVSSYLVTKYTIFFSLLAFRDDRFKSIVVDNSASGKEIIEHTFFYCINVLVFIFFLSLIFFAPIYFSFKQKNPIYLILFLILILVIEYFFYTYLASPSDLVNGAYNVIISILLLLVFFYRHIASLFRHNTIAK